MDYAHTVFNLITGINHSEVYTVVQKKDQFYSNEQHRPITMYGIKVVKTDPETGKNKYKEVFRTGVQLYLVFFLRNFWYYINGTEIPKTDFPKFEFAWDSFVAEELPELERDWRKTKDIPD